MSMKLYDESDIQNIANAIRSKGGGSDSYTIGEMAQAIADMEVGGDGWTAAGIANGTEPNGIVTVEATYMRTSYALIGPTSGVVIYAPNITKLNEYAGYAATNARLIMPNCTSAAASGGRTAWLQWIIMPKFVLTQANVLRDASYLTLVDIKTIASNGYFCSGASKLETLIIRNTAVGAVASTSLSLSASHHLTVYVPQSLITSYQGATNWSTWYANGWVEFVALEGSPYESTTWWEGEIS